MNPGKGICIFLVKFIIGCGQVVLNWLPFILSAVCFGFLMRVVLHHTPPNKTFNVHSITQPQRHESSANPKNPIIRRVWTSYSPSQGSMDYSFRDNIFVTKLHKEIWKEEKRLLNLTEFEWMLNNRSICEADPNAPSSTRILPVLVHSSRDHAFQRRVIRKTWGSLPIYKGWDLRLVFLLGTHRPLVDDDLSDPEEEDYILEAEQERHGDLVMGSFPETFKSKTYKHMMGYKWVLNFCSNAEFVMKADDDKFVDIIRWLDWRREDLEKKAEKSNTKIPDLYCDVFSNGEPVRDEGSSFYVSTEEWSDDKFPDYCSSWAYAITTDLMKMLYSVADEKIYFWIDDVYFGDLLRLVKEKAKDWTPEVRDCFKTHMGAEKMYRDICEKNGETHFELEKQFGPVVDIKYELFEQDMACLWNKTLYDANYFSSGENSL